MSYTSRQKSFIDEFRAEYVKSYGYPARPSDWTLAERENYNKALSRFIVGNPQIFDQPHILTASRIGNTPIRELEKINLAETAAGTTAWDLAGLGYVLNDGLDRINRINPFSDMNLNQTYLIAGVAITAVAIVIAYKVSPKNVTGK